MKIHLGYEVGSGRTVEVPLRHLAVIGQTQLSGKTTTLEALIARSGLRGLAFVTKRGEKGFTVGRKIQPYFREMAGWQFVSSLLEATLKEKKRFERAWIQRACRGARTLADVHQNAKSLMASSKRSMDQDQYMLLVSYLDIIVPQIRKLPASPALDLKPGVNVMDLTPYTTEMQMLVIRSALEWILEKEDNVVSIIPEAWEFVPEGKGSPVKAVAEALVRKGAGIKNFVWIDSQDIAGVAKVLLRAASVWLIGVQREANELKRSLANIPHGVRKPTGDRVATLECGEFFACFGQETIKVYVQPAWMDSETAVKVARGETALSDVQGARLVQHAIGLAEQLEEEDAVTKEQAEKLEKENWSLKEKVRQLEKTIESLKGQRAVGEIGKLAKNVETAEANGSLSYEIIKARLLQEPEVLRVLAEKPQIEVTITRPTITCDGTSIRGRLAQLIADGFFDEATTGQAAFNELKRRGVAVAKPSVYREADKLAEMGFLTIDTKEGYQSVPDMKVKIVEN